MTKEIGSEFHSMLFEEGHGLCFPRPGTLVFSGRTAIEAVLKRLPYARSALLPSYCCASMIEPFRAAGIDVGFYKVDWYGELKVEIKDTADILVWCNYFGYKNEMQEFNGVIIEDITHSMFSTISSHIQSDYLVASLRKWEPVNCGGYCSVVFNGSEPSEEFVDLKTSAMKLKAEYLKQPNSEKKERFLLMFRECNNWLAEKYSGLIIDPFSSAYLKRVNMEEQRRVRRENAKALYKGLERRVQFMFPIKDMDCPLFVPILLPNRDEVREHLIKNEIYCPVHWPKPEGCESNIYGYELSLICDQRYRIEDMERIVSVIREVI